MLAAAVIAGVSSFTFSQRTSGQIGSMSTLQNIVATYAVSIVPGAAQRTSTYHYYPPAIAVPTGTTVAWFNNDFGQPHTVTSGSLAPQTLVSSLTPELCQQLQTRSFNIHSTKQENSHTIVRYIHGGSQ